MSSRIAYMLDINNRRRIADVEGATPLLWVMTDEPGLSCMPFACAAGLCGACTIEVDGVAVRACAFPVEEAVGRKIVSPGGLSRRLGG
jgi:aerobic-type carbon monoxide dehydrogenase small subunit (CoxS/CutS family)